MTITAHTESRHWPLGEEALDQLFRQAWTYSALLDRPVSDATLRQLYELMKWGTDQRQRLPGAHPLPAY